MVSRTKLTVLVGSIVLLTALLALGLATVSAASVNLSIEKQVIGLPHLRGFAIAGEELIYEIRIDNYPANGTDGNVIVSDTLPSEVTYLGATAACELEDDTLTCNLGQMADGEYNRIIEVKVLVNPDAVEDEPDGTAVLVNSARVDAPDDTETDLSDNAVEFSIFVEDSADLSVVKMSKPDIEVGAGELFTYTIFVENLGPSYARNVSIRDEILSSGAFTLVGGVRDDPNRDSDACWVAPGGGIPEGPGETIECNLNEPLEPKDIYGEGRWIIQVVVQANQAQDVNNLVNVFSGDVDPTGLPSIPTPDPDLLNNTAQDFISVEAVANLWARKYMVDAGGQEIPPTTLVAGSEYTFALHVHNNGPSTAENVVLEDLLPAGVTVVGVIPEGPGSCTTGIPGDPFAPLVCNLGYLGPDQGNRVFVHLRIDPDYVDPGQPSDTRELQNDLWAYSDIFDPDNSDNRAHVILQVGTWSDVVMSKSGPELAKAGEEIIYNIGVANSGPSTLRGFLFYDNLPPEAQYLAYEFGPGRGSCVYPWSGQHIVVCYLDDMPPGAESHVQLRVAVKPNVTPGTVILNRIGGFFSDSDANPELPDSSATVTATADLSIEKTSEPPKVFPGEQKVYHITVTNNGPSDAPNVVVSDTLPMELRYQIDTDNCDVIGGPPDLLRCDLGTIPAGQSAQFDIHALVEPDYPVMQSVEITNIAEVWMDTQVVSDTIPGNNSDWTTNLILPPNAADLDLYKFASCSGTCLAGNDVTFVLYVNNYGPLTAQNVVLEDLLPEGVTVTDYQVYRNTSPLTEVDCNTGIPGDPDAPFTCGLGDVAVGDQVQVNIFTVIDPDYMGYLENDAVVSSDLFDPNNGNNRASVIVRVYTEADLSLVKQAPPPGPWSAGEIHTYRYNITNDGPSVSRDVRLRDFLPDEAEFVSAYAFKEGSTGGIPLPCNASAANVLICPLGDIPPTDPPGVTVLVDVHIKPDVENGTTIRNDADLITDTWDPDGAEDSIGKQIENQADLSVWKEADPWKVYAGEQVMYTIRVTNNGPGNAYDVDVVDLLPEDVDFELFTDRDCEYDEGLGEIQCDWDMLGVGETRTFYIFARVRPDAEPGTVSNSVTVDETYDPIDYNDYASAPILIQGKADLRVLKYGKPDGVVEAGDELTYTVIVDNLGPGYAHNVVLSDLFSSSSWAYHLDDWRTDLPADCYIDRHGRDTSIFCELEYPLEVMSPEESPGRWVLKFYFDVFEEQSVNNVAQVVGSDEDPDKSNNLAIVEHEVTAVADLDLKKEASGEILIGCDGETDLASNEVAAGGTLTYTLEIYNEGPSQAENVVVEDWGLSPFLDIVDVECEKDDSWRQCSCNLSGLGELGDINRHLVCYLGEIDDDDEDVITIRARIPSDVPEGTRLVNDARVYSDVFDDDNGDNLAGNWTYVTVRADLGVEKSQEPEITLPGLEVVYTIVVTNTGPSDAHGVLISDTLPFNATSLTVEGCASDGGQCDVPCEVPTCPAGECQWPDVDFVAQADIPAGEYVIYTLTAIPEWVPCEPITNTAQVGFAPGFDDIDPCDCEECDGQDFAYTVSDPECNFVPLVLKAYPGPDSPP